VFIYVLQSQDCFTKILTRARIIVMPGQDVLRYGGSRNEKAQTANDAATDVELQACCSWNTFHRGLEIRG